MLNPDPLECRDQGPLRQINTKKKKNTKAEQ